MKKFFSPLTLLASVLLCHAQGTIFYNVFLNGANMVPSNSSTNTGYGTFNLNGAVFSYSIPFALPGPGATSASIFGPALPGQTASELFSLDVHFVAPGINGEPGYISFFGNTNISPADVSQLDAGLWYVVVNTTAFPGGELRGQIVAVPEPSPAWLALLGAGLFLPPAFVLRLRKRFPSSISGA